MKHVTIRATTALSAVLLLSSAALAQSVKGTVQKVDKPQGKVTLQHGPIPKFDMDDMTMVYRVQDPAMLKTVKAGDKVTFEADKVNGQFTVTKIQKSK